VLGPSRPLATTKGGQSISTVATSAFAVPVSVPAAAAQVCAGVPGWVTMVTA